MSTMILDEKTSEKLCAYAPGDGTLSVLWRLADNAPSRRIVTQEDAQRLADALNQKDARNRWTVSRAICLQAELRKV